MTESSDISTVDDTNEDDLNGKLIQVKNLKTYFYTEEGVVKAVDGVNFDIYEDEVIGLVGETGCGKSVTALSILNLVRAPGKIIDGKVIFKGKNLVELDRKQMRQYRGKEITMIFQDPLNSLNPVMTVGTQVGETYILHQDEIVKAELDRRLLERKKIKEEIKSLRKELKDEEARLSEEEKEEIELNIEELKEQSSHTPVLKDIIRDFSAQIIKEAVSLIQKAY
jgi:ABC-type dipeptide/oligopeptide/nickel transport system ATPase component